MQRSAVLRTMGGIFPWLIKEVIKFLLIDTGFEICLLRLPKPLPPNFKALFSSRNILRAPIDATVLLAGRCHVGHKNANRLHAHGSACTLVDATQDGA
jgi:hypothetical protein